jgi:poly [ADP-ribose] polymerase
MEPNQPYKLKVQELRDELAKRGLDTTGRKPDLADRLNAAIMDELNSKAGNDPYLKTSGMEVDKRREENNGKRHSIDKDNTDSAVGGEKRHRPSNKQSLDEDDRDSNTFKNDDSVTMAHTLKVQELRNELAKRGLDASGRKSDLVARLDKAIMDEMKSKDDNISTDNIDLAVNRERNNLPSTKQSRDRDSTDVVCVKKRDGPTKIHSQDGDKDTQKCKDDVKNTNSVADEKINQSVSEKISTLKDDNEIDSSKRKKDIDINSMTVDGLRQELSTRGLSTSGTKKVLVERLGATMKDSSITVKVDVQNEQDGGTDKSLEKNIVLATKKGSAVLDKWLPDDIKSYYHVLHIGDNIFDAMLNQTNVGENNNKFYVIQVLEADTGGKYMVYNRWGRVGVKGQDKLFGPFVSCDEAISEFESKFFDKTKNQWCDRHTFILYPKKYTWLEMDYEGDKSSKQEQIEKKEIESIVKHQPRQSKLDNRLAQFISLICNVSMMKQQMMEIGYNAEKLPLGKLSKSTILKGYEVLKRISIAIEQRNRDKVLEQLSSEFYTVVPHDFGFKKMRGFIIDTPQKLKQKLEMVEALGEIELATKLLNDDIEEEEDPLYSHYQRLRCNILPLDGDSEDVVLIKRYLSNTHAKTHSSYTIEILQVFKVSRDDEDERFEKFHTSKNRMLLWHGSRLTNWTGILSQGLRIAPPEAPVTGYMFGKGVYFADMVSKSANYCYPSRSSPIGVLLLCEVALGDMVELRESDYHADNLPTGKLSTKGVGQTAPDPSEFCSLPDGVVVPLGTPKMQSATRASLLYNEFIVYNVEQIRMRYVLQVKFNFK